MNNDYVRRLIVRTVSEIDGARLFVGDFFYTFQTGTGSALVRRGDLHCCNDGGIEDDDDEYNNKNINE